MAPPVAAEVVVVVGAGAGLEAVVFVAAELAGGTFEEATEAAK
jgi:hypothetical protein